MELSSITESLQQKTSVLETIGKIGKITGIGQESSIKPTR